MALIQENETEEYEETYDQEDSRTDQIQLWSQQQQQQQQLQLTDQTLYF